MDHYYYAWGWGLFFWPLLFFFLMWSLTASWPDSWGHRGRRYYGRYLSDEWDYPYFTGSWRGKFRGRGPKNYHRADNRIAEDINDRLLVNGDVDATDIDVIVSDGVVTLKGRVSTRSEKRVAEWLAESVPGVVDVKNEIKVERSAKNEKEKAA